MKCPLCQNEAKTLHWYKWGERAKCIKCGHTFTRFRGAAPVKASDD